MIFILNVLSPSPQRKRSAMITFFRRKNLIETEWTYVYSERSLRKFKTARKQAHITSIASCSLTLNENFICILKKKYITNRNKAFFRHRLKDCSSVPRKEEVARGLSLHVLSPSHWRNTSWNESFLKWEWANPLFAWKDKATLEKIHLQQKNPTNINLKDLNRLQCWLGKHFQLHLYPP